MDSAIGGANPYSLAISTEQVKSVSTVNLVVLTQIYMGSDDVRLFPTQLHAFSTDAASIKVNGWYTRIIRKDINIIDINAVTNLSYTPSPTNGIVASDAGTDATIPLADVTNAGLLKPAKYTVLENTSGTNTGDQDLSGLQPKGVRITNATTTGAYALDWNAADVWELTLTGATVISDTNLPTGTATKVIELIVKGAFSITLPAYWEATPASEAYTGAKWNHYVVSCINGTAASERVIYSNEVLTT